MPLALAIPNQGNKQKSVKHKGATGSTAFANFIFSFLGTVSFNVKLVLSDGWVPGQASFTFLPYKGGGRGRPGTQGVQESMVGYKNKNL